MKAFFAICSLFIVFSSFGCVRSSAQENVSAGIEAEPSYLSGADDVSYALWREQAAGIAAVFQWKLFVK